MSKELVMESSGLIFFNRVIRLAVVFAASVAVTSVIMLTLQAHAATGDALDQAFRKAMVEHDDARQSYGSNSVADRIDFRRDESAEKIGLDLREADVAFEQAMKENSRGQTPEESLESSSVSGDAESVQKASKPAPITAKADARI